MLVYECDVGCGAWKQQFLGRHQRHGKGENSWKYIIGQGPTSDKACEHCGSKMHIAGPMWGGPLHNGAFIEKILEDIEKADKKVYQTLPRIEGMLDTALSELEVNREVLDFRSQSNAATTPDGPMIPQTPPQLLDHHPFYFTPSTLCKVIKAVAPAENVVKGALRHAGYVVTRSHAKAGSLKTDAPWNVLWEVMREWVRQKSPVNMAKLREGGPGRTILEKTRIAPVEEALKVNGEVVIGDDVAAGAADPAINASGDGAAAATAADAANNATTAAEDAETPDITVNGAQPAATRPDPTKEVDVSKLTIVFDEKLGRDKPGKKHLVRYQQNPRENWGPMARAKGNA